ncbi:hypothetical protein SteCoe_37468 [Stentor coeruleus]|uniref:Tyrosine-protein kinase ephrin type A/B receptor-like domain-containing protein n=1 Tax=Stentor coeruleus TaxID=5963 RepID=A0A1R2AN14_9CILI|nr:hypothetical protein SteCoe_37468 [Stentor coeruleus]
MDNIGTDFEICYYDFNRNLFNFIGNSLVGYQQTSISNAEVFYESSFYIFTGYKADDKPMKKIFRADMNNPGAYYEEIELINFEYRAMPGVTSNGNEIYIFGGYLKSYTNEIVVAKQGNLTNTLESIKTYSEYSYPNERVYSSFDAIDNRIILFGGYDKGVFYNDMWSFQSKTNLWSSIEVKGTLPSRRRCHASGSQGDALVVWGGEGKTGIRNDMFIFNVLRNFWKQILPNNNGPRPITGACGVLNFPKFYIFGGKTYTGVSNEAWEYNFYTNYYSMLKSSPVAFYNAKCQLLKGKIYILGAVNSEGVGLNSVPFYIISEDLWKLAYAENKKAFYSESISMMFPEYLVEYGGIYKNIESNNKIRVYKEKNYANVSSWSQKWTAFATGSAYVLSKLIYFSGGLQRSLVSITTERSDNKFNYINIYDIVQDLELNLYCAPGSFKNSKGKCEFCPRSSYAEGLGNVKCIYCPPGTMSQNFGLSSKRQCYPCEEGTFNSKSGQKRCLICPNNEYCPIGSTKPLIQKQSFTSSSIQPKSFKESEYIKETYNLFIIISLVSLVVFIILLFLIPKVISNIYKLDLYKDIHVNEIGQPLVLKKKKLGGIFTIIFIGAGVFIFGLNVINYFLRNIEESKALQPLSVFENEVDNFVSEINVTASFGHYLDSCAANGQCNDEVDVTSYNIIKGKIEKICEKVDQFCNVIFLCRQCEIGTQSQLIFKMNEAYSFSSTISVSISSDSSIPESKSSFSRTIFPKSKEVFIGSTPSEFCYSLTPSVFYSTFSKYPSRATGYHISEYSTPITGSSFTIENLITESGLKVIVKLEKSTFGFFTFRYEKQSAFIVSGATIGSIAGIFQVLGFLMGIIEGFLESLEKRSNTIKNLNNLIQNSLKLKMENSRFQYSDSDNQQHEEALLLLNSKNLIIS